MFSARLAVAATLLLSIQLPAATPDEATRRLARDIFQQLIEINTTDSVGSTTVAAQAMAKRLSDAGIPEADIKLAGPNDRKGNLVVRLHGAAGTKFKPILLIGHLDVVEARREDWTTDPFQFVEKDGYFYGRGTQDMKVDDAILTTTFIRFRREGYRPDRDLILALTADEEGGKSNGVDWLLKNHRDLIDAEFVLNADAGGVTTMKGKAVNVDVEASEKQYADFELTSLNPGGHSSLPTPDNAIYHLADALSRLEHTPFPVELNAVTRTYFERRAPLESGQTKSDMNAVLHTPPDAQAVARLSKEPRYNSMLRTTCVATRLSAGHANNALPQTAQAIVNCRILPGHSSEEVRQELIRIFADPKVVVRYVDNAGNVSDRAPDAQRVRYRDAAARGIEAAGTRGRRDVARRARDPGHGNRGVRQHLYRRRRLTELRHQRSRDRSERRSSAWQGRARAREFVLRRRRVLLPVSKGPDFPALSAT
jgi:acetylornithine deacetylase/succinyl-diaminopimelate desuccinylase-like protein